MIEERHDIFDLVLYDKEKTSGRNILGEPVTSYLFKIRCALCHCQYVRFCFSEEEFNKAVIGQKMQGQQVTDGFDS